VLGGGVDNQVWSVAVRGYRLWAGGVFQSVGGGIESPWLARYGCRCYPDCDNSGALSVADFGCFQTQFVLGDLYTDCDLDGVLTVSDFGCYQAKFLAGCP
jgi:hypothetical protein